MEFEVRDRVMLKVSPWNGVIGFGKRGKLNPRYVRPFKVLSKVGKVAYSLELPQELSRVLSSPGNVKIRSKRNTHISSQTGLRHPPQAKKVLRAATSPCHYISQNCITTSSPNHSTSNNEDAFSSNIPDYVSTIPDYFPASSGKTYSNALNNSTGKIPPKFSPFYNMKHMQAFHVKKLPIPSPYPITQLVILTPSPVLPPSLLFDHRYFFVPEELLPPKKQIDPPSSSSTTLSKLSRKQIHTYEPSSPLVHTPTLPPLYEPGKDASQKGINIYSTSHDSSYFLTINFRCKCVEEDRVAFSTSTLTNDALSW
nr:putative reverse transcriptase domain-containing protein [Tanacetum cinerariifolium]